MRMNTMFGLIHRTFWSGVQSSEPDDTNSPSISGKNDGSQPFWGDSAHLSIIQDPNCPLQIKWWLIVFPEY